MIERYSTPEMSQIWSQENKFSKWLLVEICIAEAWSEIGIIPRDVVPRIKLNARFDIKRIDELEKETRHDVVAFLQNIQENTGDEGKYLHFGVTSSDIVDTALSVLLVESINLIEKRIMKLTGILKELALKHRNTLIAGRTHGVHAEPTSFGLKALLWYSTMSEHMDSLKCLKNETGKGKISGAVGTYATVDPRVEEYVCGKLNLLPAKISTQILQRESHAKYLFTMALIGCTIEKIATEIRHLQRSEVLEVNEGFGKKQTGSSAMPHKKNPVSSENLCGLSRVLRGNSLAAMENIALWHERDISHSSAERIILPDSSMLIDYMLLRLCNVLIDLNIHPARMKKNLESTRGLVFSQRVLLAMIDKGMDRGNAYRIVQESAKKVWDDPNLEFINELKSKDEIKALFSGEEIGSFFDYSYYLKHVNGIYSRFEM